MTDSTRGRVTAVLLVAALAGGLRLARLGHWAFTADEVATFEEADHLRRGDPGTDPTSRLPRLIPLGYYPLGPTYDLLGRGEFAARLPAAVAGSLLPPLVVGLLWRRFGGWPAAAAGLLAALSPDQINQSQMHRFYTTAGLLAGAAVLLADVGIRRRSAGWLAAGCGCGLAGVFAHSVLALLLPAVGLAVLVGVPAGPDRRRLLWVVTAAGVALAGVLAVHVLPQARGWNAGGGWGYSVPRAVLGGVSQLGPPVAALAAVGVGLLVADRHPGRWVWAGWAGVWAGSLVVLPNVMVYHPAYSSVFLVGPLVTAGYAAGELARRAHPAGWVRAGVLAGLLAVGLPGLVSHYADGSRFDTRTAAHFLADRRTAGEPAAAVSAGVYAHYRPELADLALLRPEALRADLERFAAAAGGRPGWVVLQVGRGGLADDVIDWLAAHARRVRVIRAVRLDYYEFAVEVYRVEPAAGR